MTREDVEAARATFRNNPTLDTAMEYAQTAIIAEGLGKIPYSEVEIAVAECDESGSEDEVMRLSDSAVLVQLAISQWTARKYDRKISKEVADTHGTTQDAGRYNKMLLPANDALTHIHKKTTFIRQKFYDNTLPWGLEGQQILPTSNYLNFMNEFRKEHSEWNSLVSTFVGAYPDLKRDAKRFLPGGMYNEQDYPNEKDIYRRFKMDLAVFPVPSTDFRTQLAEGELASIRSDIEGRITQASHSANCEIWQRLYDKVKHIHEKLADPKAVFRDSTFENAAEVCELVTRLNFTNDQNLELMRQAVESKITSLHPDALRNDPDKRRETAGEAATILKIMDDCMRDLP